MCHDFWPGGDCFVFQLLTEIANASIVRRRLHEVDQAQLRACRAETVPKQLANDYKGTEGRIQAS